MFKFIKKIFILILIIIILVCSFITYEGYSMYKEVISKESIEKNKSRLKNFIDEKDHWAHLDICEAANTHEYYIDSENNEIWTRILNY